MNTSLAPEISRIHAIGEFTLERGRDARQAETADLLHEGRRVATLEARVLEAQFRLADGSTLLLASSDEAFEERLSLLLLGPDLKQRDLLLIGGATTPGFLAYAEAHGPDEIAFCWHDLEQVVTVRPCRSFLGLRRRWLTLRDLVPQRDLRRRARGKRHAPGKPSVRG